MVSRFALLLVALNPQTMPTNELPRWMKRIGHSKWMRDVMRKYGEKKNAHPRNTHCLWLHSLVKDGPIRQKGARLTVKELKSIIGWVLANPPRDPEREEVEVSERIIANTVEPGTTLSYKACTEGVKCARNCPTSKLYMSTCNSGEFYAAFLKESFTEKYPIAVAVFFLYMSKTVRGNTVVEEVCNELPRLKEIARETLLGTLHKHCTFLFLLDKDDRILINIQVRDAMTMLHKVEEEGFQEPYKWTQGAYMRYLGEEILSYLETKKVDLATLTEFVEPHDVAEVRDAMGIYFEILKHNAAFEERNSECPDCYMYVAAPGKVSIEYPKRYRNWRLNWFWDFKKTQAVEGVLGVEQGPEAFKKWMPHRLSIMPKKEFVDEFHDSSIPTDAFLKDTVGMTDSELLALWTEALRDVRTPENCKARTAAGVHSHHWWMLFFLSTWMRAHADD